MKSKQNIKMKESSNKESFFSYEKITVILIILMGVLVRLTSVVYDPLPLYHDEAYNGMDALNTVKYNNWRFFYPGNFGREGLYICLQAVSIMIFGKSIFALRIVSAIFGSLTMFTIYHLAKMLHSRKVALWATFFLATGLWPLIFAKIGFEASIGPFITSTSIYLLIKAYRDAYNEEFNETTKNKTKIKNNKPPETTALLGGIFCGLSFHIYKPYLITTLVWIYLIYYYWKAFASKRKTYWIITIIGFVSALLVALPIILYIIYNTRIFLRRTFESTSSILGGFFVYRIIKNALLTYGMFFFYGDSLSRHNIEGKPIIPIFVRIFFVIGFYACISKLFSKKSVQSSYQPPHISPKLPRAIYPPYFLPFCIFIQTLPGVLTNQAPHSLRSIAVYVAVYITAGIGAEIAREYIVTRILPNMKFICKVLTMLLVLYIAVDGYRDFLVVWPNQSTIHVAFNFHSNKMAEEIAKYPEELPKYIMINIDAIENPSVIVMYHMNMTKMKELKDFNLHFLYRDHKEKIPSNAFIANITDYV